MAQPASFREVIPEPKTIQEAKAQADSWERAQRLDAKSYIAVAFFNETGEPNGLFKVGQHPRVQRVKLAREAEEAQMSLDDYLASLREKHIAPAGGPYVVNVVNPFCDCPAFGKKWATTKNGLVLVQNRRYCKHLFWLLWKLSLPHCIAESGRLMMRKGE